METKKTKTTQKTGEVKPTNMELLRQMVNVSNNSHMTNDMAKILSQKMDQNEMQQLLEWFRHTNRKISNKLANGRRF